MSVMKDCCEIRAHVPERQRRVLMAVLWINAGMFLGEFGAGLLAHSTALLADSVDMLGDAIVYGFSLYAIARGAMWQARAAFLKGLIMAAFGLGVLLEVTLKVIRGVVPTADVMGSVGGIALAANAFCLWLLWRRRSDDINMASAWVCSRNDVMANVAVLIAAGAVGLTGSAWPDIVVGVLIAALFGGSAVNVIGRARRELRSVVEPVLRRREAQQSQAPPPSLKPSTAARHERQPVARRT
jgi:Co/Zn/Cd efflux system component